MTKVSLNMSENAIKSAARTEHVAVGELRCRTQRSSRKFDGELMVASVSRQVRDLYWKSRLVYEKYSMIN